jgi:hypothetical protein
MGTITLSPLAEFFKMQFMQQCYQDVLPSKVQQNWFKNSGGRHDEGKDMGHYSMYMRNCNDFLNSFF